RCSAWPSRGGTGGTCRRRHAGTTDRRPPDPWHTRRRPNGPRSGSDPGSRLRGRSGGCLHPWRCGVPSRCSRSRTCRASRPWSPSRGRSRGLRTFRVHAGASTPPRSCAPVGGANLPASSAARTAARGQAAALCVRAGLLGQILSNEMTLAPDVEEFLRTHTRTMLVTLRSDGSPTVHPMVGLWGDDALWFNTYRKSVKVKNIERDPRVCCVVLGGDDELVRPAVVIHGNAEVMPPGTLMPTITDGSVPRPSQVSDAIVRKVSDRVKTSTRILVRVPLG